MNKKNENYYYIASPGWSDKDKEDLKFIEGTLDAQHMDYFSPFKHGGMLKLYKELEKSKVSVKVMFDENVNQIHQCTDMIARTEGFDKGTFFEVGCFIGFKGVDYAMKHLTLIGDNSDEAAKILSEVIANFDNHIEAYKVIDISEKAINKYIELGICYGKGIKVVSFSDKPLSSNIMTACSVVAHYQADESIKSVKDLSDRVNNNKGIYKDGKLFNLSALKLSDNIK